MHTTFNITIMMDLFLIAMAAANALLLFAFYRILHVNPEAKNKMFYFQFNDGLDFINYLAKDFLFFMILAHLMLFCGLEECLTLWIAGGLHIVADIMIITLRYLRHRQPLQ